MTTVEWITEADFTGGKFTDTRESADQLQLDEPSNVVGYELESQITDSAQYIDYNGADYEFINERTGEVISSGSQGGGGGGGTISASVDHGDHEEIRAHFRSFWGEEGAGGGEGESYFRRDGTQIGQDTAFVSTADVPLNFTDFRTETNYYATGTWTGTKTLPETGAPAQLTVDVGALNSGTVDVEVSDNQGNTASFACSNGANEFDISLENTDTVDVTLTLTSGSSTETPRVDAVAVSTTQVVTGVSATGVDSGIEVNWTDTYADYDIERAPGATSTPNDFSTLDTNIGPPPYTDSDMVDGQEFSYRIVGRGYNAYTPPENDEVDISASTGYTPPGNDEVDVSPSLDRTNPSAAVTAVSVLDPPTLSLTPGATSVDISSQGTDDNPNTEYEVYTSTDRSIGALDHTWTGKETETYTSSPYENGQTVYVTARAVTPDAQTNSAQKSTTTLLPLPTDVSAATVTAKEISIEWTDNAADEDGYRVYISRDSGQTWTNVSGDLNPDTESYTASGLLNGESYNLFVEVFTADTERDTAPIQETTGLPDAQAPILGNGVEDEVSADWTDVINYGSYRIQIRETRTEDITVEGWEDGSIGSAWSDDAGGFTVEQDGSLFGSYNLVGTSEFDRLWSFEGDGLPEYFQRGADQTLTFYTRTPVQNQHVAGVYWGVYDADNNYFSRHQDGDFEIVQKVGGSNTTIDTTAATCPADTTLRWEVTWEDPGVHTLTVYDDDTDTEIATVGPVTSTAVADNTGSTGRGLGIWEQEEDANVRFDNFTVDPAWGSLTDGFDAKTLDETVTSTIFTAREDGESYHVRLRTETEHKTGDWTVPVQIITKFPGASSLTATEQGSARIDLSWVDNADNEDGFRVERRRETNPSFPDDTTWTAWSVIDTLPPNTTTYEDTGLDQNRKYQYRIEAFTDDTSALSPEATDTTDIIFTNRWNVVLTRPDGERVAIREDAIQSVDVARPHTAMADYSLDIAYAQKKLAEGGWLTSTVKSRVRFDGSTLFNGYLESADSDAAAGRTTIEGRGITRDLSDQEAVISFSNVAVHEAIDRLWSDYTDFDFTVYEPPVTLIEDGATIGSFDSTLDLSNALNVADTVPAYVQNGRLYVAQTCWGWEAEDHLDLSGTITNTSDTENASNDGYESAIGVESSQTPAADVNYRIPASNVGIAIRWKLDDDNDDDGDFEVPGFDVSVDGNTLESRPAWTKTGAGYDGGWFWETYTGAGSDLPAGSHAVSFDVTDASNGGTAKIDRIQLFDTRFSYNFDNTVNVNNALAGPENYPDAVTVNFSQLDVTNNVVGIGVDVVIDDTSGGQSVGASADGGSTFTTASNTDTLSADFPDNRGTSVDYRLTLSRYGSRTDETPTEGFNGQSVDRIEVTYDGTSLAVIDSQTYRDDLLTIAQRLHRRGDYRFAADHGATDKNGEPKKAVESFARGDQVRSADFRVINRQPALDTRGYANHVTVRGQLSNGTRPTATAESQSEIQELGGDPEGKRHVDLTRPDLKSLEEVKSVAGKELKRRLKERDRTGALEVQPTNVVPGYDYPVDWYGDGDTVDTTSERVEFSESYQEASGMIEFARRKTPEFEIVEARFERDSTRDVL